MSPEGPWRHRFAVAVFAATVLLITAGGLVTSTGSALAVPDWPLSFGQVFPRMEGGVLFEHGHRLIATSVGILTVILAVWTQRAEPRARVRQLGWPVRVHSEFRRCHRIAAWCSQRSLPSQPKPCCPEIRDG